MVNCPYHQTGQITKLQLSHEFKLTNIDAINQMYGKKMAKMNETTWHVSANCCGCSGDCGSNWMRS